MCKKRDEAWERVEAGMKWLEEEGKQTETMVQIKPYTIVEIYSLIGDHKYRGVGHAQQGKNDHWDSDMGYEIAFGRAVMDVARKAKLI